MLDKDGLSFSYALPDDALRGIELVDKQTSGRIGAPAPVLPEAPTRERYVINSLIEEAITSSQLEGAATTRKVAKEMLRTGRKPRTRDERMILNNYTGMLRVRELRHERLTPAMITEFHRIIADGTLEDQSDCGRLQLPGEDRVVIVDYDDDEVMHTPPGASQLPERLDRLCQFANGDLDTAYVPPVVRAILLHFMLAYDHPFVDGNGRTARLLFYWSMLSQDYWLAEFLPISRLLKKAPAQYAIPRQEGSRDTAGGAGVEGCIASVQCAATCPPGECHQASGRTLYRRVPWQKSWCCSPNSARRST